MDKTVKRVGLPSFIPFCIVITSLLITSCVSYQKLPQDWALARSSSGNTCPQIAGEYNNIGEDAHKAERRLVWYFFHEEASKDLELSRVLFYRTTHVSFQQNDQDSLQITAWRDKSILAQKTLSTKAGDFKCEDGWLIYTPPKRTDMGGLVLTESWQTIKLSKSGDDLLIQFKELAAGTFMVVPIAGADTDWMKFSAIKGEGVRDLQPKIHFENENNEFRTPQFSPDGGEIIFTIYNRSFSKIYKVDVNGAKLTILSKPGDYDTDPVYSPDGKTVAFTSLQDNPSRGSLCIMKSDGSSKVCLTSGHQHDFSPAFSHDGSKIYFIRALSYDDKKYFLARERWEKRDIYSINLDGTGLTQVTHRNYPLLTDLSLYPDGKRLLVRHMTSEIHSKFSHYSLEIIPLNNPENTESAENMFDQCETDISPIFGLAAPISCDHPEDIKPIFSPDGSALLFKWKGNAFVMDLKTRKARKIPNSTERQYGGLIDLSFSHDGSKIVLSTHEYGGNLLYTYDTPNLFIVNRDGSNMRAIKFQE